MDLTFRREVQGGKLGVERWCTVRLSEAGRRCRGTLQELHRRSQVGEEGADRLKGGQRGGENPE